MAILQVLQTNEQLMRCWQQSSKEKILERTSWSRALFSRGFIFGLFFLRLAGKECDLYFKLDIQTELRWTTYFVLSPYVNWDRHVCKSWTMNNRIRKLYIYTTTSNLTALGFLLNYKLNLLGGERLINSPLSLWLISCSALVWLNSDYGWWSYRDRSTRNGAFAGVPKLKGPYLVGVTGLAASVGGS